MPEGHGGRAVSLALKALGVDHIFTLSGAHIFPIFDGCKEDGIRIVDTRHEQSAAFAAEGMARLTRSVGVCAVTAGPGVTNIMSPLAQAGFNGAPVLALGGRAPAYRWGQGSLQELDHVPFVDPLAPAHTIYDTSAIPKEVLTAGLDALTPPMGPRFLDFPLDILFNTTDFDLENGSQLPEGPQPDTGQIEEIAKLLDAAERPLVVAGSGVWLERGDQALRDLAERAELPVFMNGQGRGCLPADHRLAFARSRSAAFKQADLVIVAGTPLDFRLGFGQFAKAQVVHIYSGPRPDHVPLAAAVTASTKLAFEAIASATSRTKTSGEWLATLTAVEEEKAAQAQAELQLDSKPIHPMRLYGELVPLLDRDAIVIGDGGDFVSYAGREVPSYAPGCWLDPGPFGCLGVGSGYAMAARLAHPDRQVVTLFGDGAIGFSGMELETMVRLNLPVVCVVGNNGIWALEKFPMQAIYGYDVAAELQHGTRYDKVMEAFGGRGELVEDPAELGPALKRAFDAGEPYVVNVLTDPTVAYPRSANLA
ncbi:MAG: acetolactate synthase [Actinomycetota bacterium]|nr:acetolactate synthase [Actinomycetota bacterium]